MLSSISGQSDRWAQLAAYRSPSAAQPGLDAGGPPSGSSSISASLRAGAVSGGTVPAISSGTNAALLALAGVSGAAANQDKVGGPPTDQLERYTQAAANRTPPAYTETGSLSGPSGSSGGVPLSIGADSSLLTLVGLAQPSAAFAGANRGGTDNLAAAVSAVGGPAPINGRTGNPPSTTTTATGGVPPTGPQQLATDPDVLASITGSGPAGASGTPSAPPPPSGPPPANGDIVGNNGTTVASNSGTTSAGDNTPHVFQQQFAASAYASNAAPGLTSGQISAFGSISA